MLSDATLAYAEELTTALLGVDALYRAESGDQDGLVVLNMSTSHQPEQFASYDDARARFADLERRAAELPEPDRQLYYAQACRSTLAVISWRRGELPFTGQDRRFPACARRAGRRRRAGCAARRDAGAAWPHGLQRRSGGAMRRLGGAQSCAGR